MDTLRNRLNGFEDPKRLHKIDKLMELGISDYVSLPQLVVVGDQSSGKSSVLEGLTDLPFPRDSTLCTRFATQIVFRRAEKESIFVSIIPSASCDPERANKLRFFKVNELETLSANTFASILSKACDAMGIPSPGNPVMSGQSTFSSDVFRVELRGPSHSHLSVIDVPGIFRTPTEGLTTKEDMALVNGLVRRFIKNERTIILAVLPANVDIATQEILGLAGEVDPHGQRTLGVLTKPDLVDRGAEKDVIDLVQGKKNKLRLGYCVVRNRGHQERMTSSSERHGTESVFFNTGPFASLSKDRLGIPALHKRLRDLLNDITQREFPNVKREISQRILACETELRGLGPSRESDDQQRRFLLDLAVKFQQVSSHALEARYSISKYFDDRQMRLATRIVTMNDAFSEAVEKRGCSVEFDTELPPPPDLNSPRKFKLKRRHSGLTDRTLEPREDATPQLEGEHSEPDDVNEYPELSDVIQYSEAYNSQGFDDIIGWIECIYKLSRGFELGTFDPMILPLLFQEQTVNWEHLTMSYINGVILCVHRFCDNLLSYICAEERVKCNLWSYLVEELVQRYKKTVEHVRFILRTEREGNLITTNHYFNENLEKARAERLRAAANEMTEQQWDRSPTSAKLVNVDKIVKIAGIGNLQHTVRDIHDILKAYYTVARKRFVDNVCMQGTDYHLVSGPETPLRVFSPEFVGNLTSDQLEAIAGEDTVSIQRRKELGREIESLREGRRVLAT